MPVERAPGGSSLIDVLDRILDKGIIIDAWVRISLVGIDLVTVEARVVVASIETYLRYADALGLMPAQRAGSLGAGGGSVDAATTRSRSSERA
jgi:gas vesicle structural protein